VTDSLVQLTVFVPALDEAGAQPFALELHLAPETPLSTVLEFARSQALARLFRDLPPAPGWRFRTTQDTLIFFALDLTVGAVHARLFAPAVLVLALEPQQQQHARDPHATESELQLPPEPAPRTEAEFDLSRAEAAAGAGDELADEDDEGGAPGEATLPMHAPGAPPAPGARKRAEAPAPPVPSASPRAAPKPAPMPTRAKAKARGGYAEEPDTMKLDAPVGSPVRSASSRRATVRYYARMNPDRMFPMLVVLSAREVAEVVKKHVKQATSEAFKVEDNALVEVEPVLPGCDVYPPRHSLDAGDGTTDVSTETFWIVPRVLGRVQGARVLIRQHGRVLAEVPLDVKVRKQTLAVACGLMGLAAPYLSMGLRALKLDPESQKAQGYAFYRQFGDWLAEAVRPEWIGLGFFGLAVMLYFAMRPRRREVFWDVELK
jgi:hypothetical protein